MRTGTETLEVERDRKEGLRGSKEGTKEKKRGRAREKTVRHT